MKSQAIYRLLLVFTLLVLVTGCARPNLGLYAQNYELLVPTRSDFLFHNGAEGNFPPDDDLQDADYEPSLHTTTNMDKIVLEMREKGYVMIGYSAFNTRESKLSEGGNNPMDDYNLARDDCDLQSRTEKARKNCLNWARTNYNIAKIGYDRKKQNPLGNRYQAAKWANAEIVYTQKAYSFSRTYTVEKKIITDQGDDTTTALGRSGSGFRNTYAGSGSGSSSSSGRSRTSGQFSESGKKAGVGGQGGLFGGLFGSVEADTRQGTSSSQSGYQGQGSFQSGHTGGGAGTSFGGYSDTVRHQSKHWASALISKNVDHYDHMTTFWKKANLDKMPLGALTEPTPRDLWPQVGTKHSRMVYSVIGDSPAYLADIWEGDVLLAINGEKIVGTRGWEKLLKKYEGKEVPIVLWRNDQILEIPVAFNQVI